MEQSERLVEGLRAYSNTHRALSVGKSPVTERDLTVMDSKTVGFI